MSDQRQMKALQWTRQIDLLCPRHQEAIETARAFSIPELDDDAVAFITRQLFNDLFRQFGNHALPEEFVPLLENLAQFFVSAAVQSGIAHRTQLRALIANALFQQDAASEAEREAARLCVSSSGMAAAARGAISGMVENSASFHLARDPARLELIA